MLTVNKLDSRPAPSAAPVDVDELKVHLRLFGDDTVTDEYLLALIGTATEIASTIIGESIGSSEYDAYFTGFDKLELPYDNVSSINSVDYYNSDNILTELDSSTYYLDDTAIPPVVRFNSGTPSVTLHDGRTGKVKVNYDVDFGDNVGPIVEQAILIIASDLYNNDGSYTDKQQFKTPVAAERLLSRFRRQRW